MKKFQNNVIGYGVNDAVMVAEKLLMPESKMLKEFREKNDWKYNSGNGEQVYEKIISCTSIVPIFTYRPKWIFTKAVGYFDGQNIHINLRKIENLTTINLVALLVHEWLHAAGFSHGNNYQTDDKNKYSVNYYASENIGKWI